MQLLNDEDGVYNC